MNCPYCSGTGDIVYRKKIREVIDPKTGAVNVREYEMEKGKIKLYKKDCPHCRKPRKKKKKITGRGG